MPTSELNVRDQLDKALGAPLTDEEWRFLEERRYIDEVWAGDLTFNELVKEVRKFRETFGQRQNARIDPHRRDNARNRGSARSMELTRETAVAQLIADEARGDQAVQEFRAHVLGHMMLAPEDVARWIENQQVHDQPIAISLTVTKGVRYAGEPSDINDPGLGPWTVKALLSEEEVKDLNARWRAWRFHLLKYPLPDGTGDGAVITRVDSVLEQLRELSERLAERYRWTEAEATHFILTDTPPPYRPVLWSLDLDPLPVLSRVSLTVEPSLSPNEVTEAYRVAREQIIGVGTRQRDLSQKHLQLALFAVASSTTETWEQRKQAWNRTYPQWPYDHATNFRRDCVQAKQRLLRTIGPHRIEEEGNDGEETRAE